MREGLKTKRDSKTYIAGAVLAFGIVLLALQLTLMLLVRGSAEDLITFNGTLLSIMYGSNLLGGFFGGYLVARHRQTDYLQTGTLVGALAYIFENIYNVFLERMPIDLYVFASLLFGGIIGSMFFRARVERIRLKKVNKDPTPENLKINPEP